MSGPHLRTKPKFIRLHTILNIPAPAARGHLEFLWDSVSDTGDADLGDAESVEAAAGWDGEPGELCQALLTCGGHGKCGFIEEVPDQPGTYRLHDLLQHTPPDRVRQWVRQQERLERGKTISELRQTAANARNPIPQPPTAPHQPTTIHHPPTTDPHPPSTALPSTAPHQPPTIHQPPTTALPSSDHRPPTTGHQYHAPSWQEVHDYFQSLEFEGDAAEFLKQYVPGPHGPNDDKSKPAWRMPAYRWATNVQANRYRQQFAEAIQQL